jgi:hypothetical protein
MTRPVKSRRPSDDHSEHFEIRVKGLLAPSWSEFFGILELTHTPSGETILCGPVADQSELHGILAKIRDLNLPLISVIRVQSAHSADDDSIGAAKASASNLVAIGAISSYRHDG